MKNLADQISLMLHYEDDKQTEEIEYASKHGYGLEIVTFSWSPLHNDNIEFDKKLNSLKQSLSDFNNNLSLHGPIADIIPHSTDAAIRKIAKERILKTLSVAEKLRADRIIFHTGINTAITSPIFFKDSISRQIDFWNEILVEYQSSTIFLENMWEYDTTILKSIVSGCGNDRLKLCFDTGHFNVYSKIPIEKWFADLGIYTSHFHFVDNLGDWDNHMTIGTGNFNWKQFMKLDNLKDSNNRFIFELTGLKSQIESLNWLSNQRLINI